ncbi:MAG: TQO small subunit DoxD [Planctomycetota bacterium]
MRSHSGIGFFGVITLVLLRMAMGWHFLDQGVDKFDPNFSSEGFLRSAKGPLAEKFQSLAHGVHNVDTLLFVPREFDPARTDAPYDAWLERISADWKVYSLDAAELAGGGSAEAFEACYNEWQARLADYLATQSDAIAEHQNELWRLEQLQANAPAGELPYNDERAYKKYGETFSASRKWIAEVRSLEAAYRDALVSIADEAGASARAVKAAVTPKSELDTINLIVKWSVTSIGVCLILGLFTRLAALGGAAFLCSVIATQPPWVAGAQTEYFWYQLVEVAGMLNVAVFGAGQWLGFDAMWKHLFRR